MNNILIGIPLGDSVKAEFFKSFLPAINLLPEEGTIRLQYTKWGNVVGARNGIVRDFLLEDFTHLFFMDSDQTFPENTLSRLLEHDKDIVGGLYTVKIPPFNTTIFRKKNGKIKNYVPKTGEGLIQVDVVATGCMLIKREVIEKMTWPYFWYEEDPPGSEKMMTEDSYFCVEAGKEGFRVWCDTNILCGHIGTAMVMPQYDNGELKVGMEMI